jgi:hypothetical protein
LREMRDCIFPVLYLCSAGKGGTAPGLIANGDGDDAWWSRNDG